MHIKTILNKVYRQPGFVYAAFELNGNELRVTVQARARSRPICSGCNRKGPGYDRLRRGCFNSSRSGGSPSSSSTP